LFTLFAIGSLGVVYHRLVMTDPGALVPALLSPQVAFSEDCGCFLLFRDCVAGLALSTLPSLSDIGFRLSLERRLTGMVVFSQATLTRTAF
jgi:hypothetical protein